MMGASGTRGDLHSDISVTNLGDSQKTLADGAVSFPGSNRASYSAVGSKSHGGVGGWDVSSSQYSAWGHHSSTGCQLKSGVEKKSPDMAQIVRIIGVKQNLLTNV